MIVLSKALTGETPNDRLLPLIEFTKHLNELAVSDALKCQIMNEYFTNERTLFTMSPVADGSIKTGDAHTVPAAGGTQTRPEAGKGEVGVHDKPVAGVVAGKSGPTAMAQPALETPPAQNHPLKPSDPGWQPAIGATVDDLTPFCSSSWGLPRAALEAFRSFGGDYPRTATERLECLRKLTPQQIGAMVAAARGEYR